MWFARSLQWEIDYETDEHLEKHRLRSSDGSTLSVRFPSWSWSAWRRTKRPNTAYWVGAPSDDSDLKEDGSLVYFYQCSKNGCLKWIDEYSDRRGHMNRDPATTMFQSQDILSAPWRESPQIIDLPQELHSGSWDVSSGLIKFWSSVGTIYLQRRPKIIAGRPWDYTILNQHGKIISHTINMQSTNHMEWLDGPNCKDYPPPVIPWDQATVLAFDAVVIGMQKPSQGSSSPNFIRALLLEWSEGVAYRRGLVTIAEHEWMGLNRNWVLLTLG